MTKNINKPTSIMLKSVLSGIILIILTNMSCSSDDGMGNEVNCGVFPDSGLSYTQHIQPIFFEDCATTPGCHQTSSQAGGLDLESSNPTFLSNNGLVVNPFSSVQSILFQTLFNEVSGVSGRMPPNAPRICDDKINAIETWINAGASTAN